MPGERTELERIEAARRDAETVMITVRLPRHKREELRWVASQQGMSLNEFCRKAIERAAEVFA